MCVCICAVCFRGFIHLAKSGVYWVKLGGIRWFGGTLTDMGGGIPKQVMGGFGGFLGLILMGLL